MLLKSHFYGLCVAALDGDKMILKLEPLLICHYSLESSSLTHTVSLHQFHWMFGFCVIKLRKYAEQRLLNTTLNYSRWFSSSTANKRRLFRKSKWIPTFAQLRVSLGKRRRFFETSDFLWCAQGCKFWILLHIVINYSVLSIRAFGEISTHYCHQPTELCQQWWKHTQATQEMIGQK